MTDKINTLIKPTTGVNLSKAAAASIGLAAAIDNDADNDNYTIRSTNNYQNNKTISLAKFSRLYKIGQIPILDFIIVYIILYILNASYFKFDNKVVFIAMIPITIVMSLLTNRNCHVSVFIIVVFVISVYFLLKHDYTRYK